jgi:transposase
LRIQFRQLRPVTPWCFKARYSAWFRVAGDSFIGGFDPVRKITLNRRQPGLNYIFQFLGFSSFLQEIGPMAKKRKKASSEIPKLESLKQLNLNAAGIDIGDEEIWVCIPEDRDTEPVRCFGTFTCDLFAIADWLKACGVDTVAMESTSIYWVPLYEILEATGVEVYLVNARHVKNVSGRKDDILDCQWLQQLHTYGLLRRSFRPEAEIVELRDLVRHRDTLLDYRAAHIQHMQKALHLMNLQLDNVISDITGYTGKQIIRAIIAGQRDPQILAQLRDPRCKNSTEVIAKSLEGNYKATYIFELQQALELYDFYTRQIKACDHEIEKTYQHLPLKFSAEQEPVPQLKSRDDRRHKHHPDYDLRTYLYRMVGVDLCAVDGLGAVLVQIILSEIGVDMSRWPTEKHFASWLCTCPNNRISGGKLLSTRTRKTTNRAYHALRLAARSLHHSDSFLGAYFRRMRARLGAPKAVTAAAHKIAKIIYMMIKNQIEFVDLGADYYEQKYKENQIAKLRRKALKFGLKVVPIEHA